MCYLSLPCPESEITLVASQCYPADVRRGLQCVRLHSLTMSRVVGKADDASAILPLMLDFVPTLSAMKSNQ